MMPSPVNVCVGAENHFHKPPSHISHFSHPAKACAVVFVFPSPCQTLFTIYAGGPPSGHKQGVHPPSQPSANESSRKGFTKEAQYVNSGS